MTPEQQLQAICAGRPLPTDEFIHHALYSPGGYYARSETAPGQRGDFFTSVSVGPQFGWLLAQHIITVMRRRAGGEIFHLIEQGAHHGILSNDILNVIDYCASPLLGKIQFIFIEPLAHLRAIQAAQPAVGRLPRPALWINSPAELPAGWGGLMYCNELLDAFPVKRFLYHNNTWLELGIVFRDGAFHEEPIADAPTQALQEALSRPPMPTQGQIREWRPAVAGWLRDIFSGCADGSLLLFDYGPAAGPVGDTTRAFHTHRQITPWHARPGECDITADVDFEHLANLATSMHLHPRIQTQGAFLSAIFAGVDRENLPAALGSAEWSRWCRHFQTLTHPEHLGHRFLAFTCEKKSP